MHEGASHEKAEPQAAEPGPEQSPSEAALSPALRREADLICLGLGAEARLHTDKIDSELLSKLARAAVEFMEAHAAPITDIFHEGWVGNFTARMNPPSVIALMDIPKLDDDAARQLVTEAISSDPQSRLYGGTRGSFVARLSPQGMIALARREEIQKIS